MTVSQERKHLGLVLKAFYGIRKTERSLLKIDSDIARQDVWRRRFGSSSSFQCTFDKLLARRCCLFYWISFIFTRDGDAVSIYWRKPPDAVAMRKKRVRKPSTLLRNALSNMGLRNEDDRNPKVQIQAPSLQKLVSNVTRQFANLIFATDSFLPYQAGVYANSREHVWQAIDLSLLAP